MKMTLVIEILWSILFWGGIGFAALLFGFLVAALSMVSRDLTEAEHRIKLLEDTILNIKVHTIDPRVMTGNLEADFARCVINGDPDAIDAVRDILKQ
jgi:hypothetical protein